jgi:hypothetical protein
MKCIIIFVAAAMGVLGWDDCALSAESTEEQAAKIVEPLRREVQRLVRQYYPEASVVASYDKKTGEEKIHFEYNTQTYVMRDPQPDNTSYNRVAVRGPYVGGIWCDMTLSKGRYAGAVKNMEKGITEIGHDFYNHVAAPYSKKLDRHISIALRYPDGTSPRFLKQFEAMAGTFDQYVGKPVEP